jgi:sterol desaturase/sphingolipid hydroxylase (fatty acid hydroxylase superfamily)
MKTVEPSYSIKTTDEQLTVSQPLPIIAASTVSIASNKTTTWQTVLRWASYWIIMGSSFGLTAWLAQDNRMPHYAWYVMAQVNVVLILLFEELIPKNKHNDLFRDRQSWNDIGHMLLFKLVCRPLVWIVALSIVSFAASHWHNSKSIWPHYLPVPIQFVVLLLVFDLIGYAYHRALHRFDFLYAFHALHHDTRKMHVLKANRLHVGEEVINFLLLVPVMIVVGCPPAMMIWLGMWEVFDGNLAHSNVDQQLPRWFHYIVRTADVHRIHHSDDPKLQNSNFAELPIWDLVFRTYRHPFENKLTTTGIEGDPVPKGFVAQLLFPLVTLFRAKVGLSPNLSSDSVAAGRYGA